MPKGSIEFHLYPGTSLLTLLAGAILCGKETAGTWRGVEFENGKSAMGCTMMSREHKRSILLEVAAGVPIKKDCAVLIALPILEKKRAQLKASGESMIASRFFKLNGKSTVTS